jgi:hypothetical protein
MSVEKIRLDFLVLGAQKAGTTSLHDMLVKHLDIALPKSKETHFFSHVDRAARGRAWYHGQFTTDNATKFKGEIDPEYLFAPPAPEAIRAQTTVKKFVIILRNPLDRAYSQYLMSLRRGYEQLGFGEALAKEEERLAGDQPDFARDHWSYAARSLYSGQIWRFRDVFPDAAFLFLRSDTLSGPGYEEVCDFIGTRPTHLAAANEVRSNSAAAPRSRAMSDLLYAPKGKSAFRRIITKAIPAGLKTRLFLWLDRQNQQPVQFDRETAYEEVPEAVLVSFADDLAETELLTGLDLADWRRGIRERLEQKLQSGSGK